MEFLPHTLWPPRGTLRSGRGVCRKVCMEETRKSLQKQPREVARLVVGGSGGRLQRWGRVGELGVCLRTPYGKDSWSARQPEKPFLWGHELWVWGNDQGCSLGSKGKALPPRRC